MLSKKFLMPLLAGLFTSQLFPPSVLAHHQYESTEPRLGAVASEASECSTIGIDLLKVGGTAADALVGTVICVGVIGMYHSGIAGGGFMTVRTSNGSYEFIDFRETAPAAAFQDMYVKNTDLSLYGGLASGIPGELRGLEYIHKHYCKLPWKNLVMPAVKIARYGFRVSEDLVRYMNSATNGQDDFLVNNPTWAIDFAPRGYRLQLNDTITRKRYADTLETIANKGPDAFYTGAIANATISALQAQNGTMTLDDLKNYAIQIRAPISTTYRGYKLTSGGAPSGGIVTLSALGIVKGLNEAIRFAYGERTKLGDPDFTKGIYEYEKRMLSESTTSLIRSKIFDSHTQDVSAYNPDGIETLETPGTSHVVTADNSGMAISLTTSINMYFGSKLMVPETGVIMNNEMNDFSTPGSSKVFGHIPSPANYIHPGKRPLSSMSPVIIEYPNGTLYVSVGAAGGIRIITCTIQNIHHILDKDFSTPKALAEPRLHDQLMPNSVSFEYAYDNSTVAFMKELGHNVTWVAPGWSSAHALRLLGNGTFEAAGEPRQKNSGGYAV
ncbi:Gamma-glutamyltranspeptidase [Macrophomina phaseolina MS6]|uniref:Glutathione hydrolase n=1 Tax=Macrophomina phaseolina (strain MS6) TaxID=1126212 RepID=K2RDP6_MACPH|nr:Gamma-glutamyltranspeptidase [Macrophomina phaseolina MS6]